MPKFMVVDIVDKSDGAKIGEIYGWDEGGEVEVYNDWRGIVQYFRSKDEAERYIKSRMAPEYDLVEKWYGGGE